MVRTVLDPRGVAYCFQRLFVDVRDVHDEFNLASRVVLGGDRMQRGVQASGLDPTRRWTFQFDGEPPRGPLYSSILLQHRVGGSFSKMEPPAFLAPCKHAACEPRRRSQNASVGRIS